MKYTFCITQQCNLRCSYCYVDKHQKTMSIGVAKKAIDFLFAKTPVGEKIDIGFFGGEPLLEFDLIKSIVRAVEEHSDYRQHKVEYSLVSNGTIYNEEIADFIEEKKIGFGISCDGPPELQDQHRCFVNGKGSSKKVEATIQAVITRFPQLMVNAVYRPETIDHLPEVVDYLASLGVTQIYMNPDFSASWTGEDAAKLKQIYQSVSQRHIDSYIAGKPLYISLIDSKITVILRGGYQPEERCNMGKGEMAFTAEGNIFPCERLIGSGKSSDHCIGNIDSGVDLEKMSCNTASRAHEQCNSCGLRDYCTNTCGCSNYFSSGYYNRTAPFLCASEQASIVAGFETIQALENYADNLFSDHVAGNPAINSVTMA